METLKIKTKKAREVVDITDQINAVLRKQSIKAGLCHAFITHTTAALTTADLDPGTDLDLLDALEEMMPKLRYRHPHDPGHVTEHIRSTLLGASVLVPFQDSELILGTWQRVVLVESSGPREREVILSFLAGS